MATLVLSTFDVIRDKGQKSNVLYSIKRSILPLIIGTLVLSGLLFSSTVAYFIFYWTYIPSVGIAKDVHLQFSREAPPWGSVDLADSGLLNSQPYAAFVEIELPRTRNNLDIGNFMVSLSMLNSVNATLAISSRPAILTYTSPIISTSLTVLNSPFFIAGFKRESETLLVPVMERFEFPAGRGSRPRWAVVEITPDYRIQVYSTKLMLVAQFEGVRWFMYSHRIIAFALFTSLFFISSTLFAGLTWFIFSLHSSTASPSSDDSHNGVVSTRPAEKGKVSEKIDFPEEDTLTISIPPTPHLDFSRLSTTSTVSKTYPPVVEREDYLSYKRGFPSDSAASESSRGDDARSTVKTEDESISGDTQDDGLETMERSPVSEI